jgi:hypothetical protein
VCCYRAVVSEPFVLSRDRLGAVLRWFRAVGSEPLVPSRWFRAVGSEPLVPSRWFRAVGSEPLVPSRWFRAVGSEPFVPSRSFRAVVSEPRPLGSGLPHTSVFTQTSHRRNREVVSNEKPPQDKPKMEPMFLPGVEQNPKPGPFTDSIRMLQRQGGGRLETGRMAARRQPDQRALTAAAVPAAARAEQAQRSPRRSA